jgi:ABC-type glycerol-3-phosphate transport system permease component
MRAPTVVQQARTHVVLGTLSIIFLFPLVGMLLAALHPDGSFVQGFSLPEQLHWQNLVAVWSDAGMSGLFASSLIIAAAVVPLTLVLATLAGYGLALLNPPGGIGLRLVLILGLAMPIEAIIVPLYYLLRDFGLTDTYTAVILVEVALFLPFGSLWMMTNFEALPRELVESARVDGARPLASLTKVLLPLSGPSMATLAALFFMWSWNQFLIVLVLIRDPDKRTVPSGLSSFIGEYTTNIPMLAAATLVAIMPVLVVYVAFQRTFVRGMLQGAIR